MKNSNNIVDQLSSTFPWKGNDIYLEQNDGQVKAVCSSKEISNFLADAVNSMSKIEDERIPTPISEAKTIEEKANNEKRKKLYYDFIQESYYLSIAMSKQHIPRNSIESILLEKAYNNFYDALKKLLEYENIVLKEEVNEQS